MNNNAAFSIQTATEGFRLHLQQMQEQIAANREQELAALRDEVNVAKRQLVVAHIAFELQQQNQQNAFDERRRILEGLVAEQQRELEELRASGSAMVRELQERLGNTVPLTVFNAVEKELADVRVKCGAYARDAEDTVEALNRYARLQQQHRDALYSLSGIVGGIGVGGGGGVVPAPAVQVPVLPQQQQQRRPVGRPRKNNSVVVVPPLARPASPPVDAERLRRQVAAGRRRQREEEEEEEEAEAFSSSASSFDADASFQLTQHEELELSFKLKQLLSRRLTQFRTDDPIRQLLVFVRKYGRMPEAHNSGENDYADTLKVAEETIAEEPTTADVRMQLLVQAQKLINGFRAKAERRWNQRQAFKRRRVMVDSESESESEEEEADDDLMRDE